MKRSRPDPYRRLLRRSLALICKYVCKVQTYISNNHDFIPNYSERHRNGKRTSTSFVESTIN